MSYPGACRWSHVQTASRGCNGLRLALPKPEEWRAWLDVPGLFVRPRCQNTLTERMKRKLKLRRNRRHLDGAVKSQLPSADAPASRVVRLDAVVLDPRVVDARKGGTFNSGSVVCGDAVGALARVPDEVVSCVVTSPPYWNVVDYGVVEQIGLASYEDYRSDLLCVWRDVVRVLRPNGKLCLNVPLMPLAKSVSAKHFGKTHTRCLLDLPGDLKADILSVGLRYYSFYIWEKQTTEKMFGSYPFPPNLLERNYCEFILVFVKPGKPRKMAKKIKEAARLSSEEWMELTKQIWWMYPANVKRNEGHPAPFPEALPNRLISMYTFPAVGDYAGDIVLDPFAGWGTTCVAAKRLGRRYVGVELSPQFCNEAVKRLGVVEAGTGSIMNATAPGS